MGYVRPCLIRGLCLVSGNGVDERFWSREARTYYCVWVREGGGERACGEHRYVASLRGSVSFVD